jgi:inorganic triphosphatase YgiF
MEEVEAIEIEKKFRFARAAAGSDDVRSLEAHLVAPPTGAVLVKRKTFEDVYYDDAAASLTRADVWLRQRDGK